MAGNERGKGDDSGVAGNERGGGERWVKSCLTDWLHPCHQETTVQRSRNPANDTVVTRMEIALQEWKLVSTRCA